VVVRHGRHVRGSKRGRNERKGGALGGSLSRVNEASFLRLRKKKKGESHSENPIWGKILPNISVTSSHSTLKGCPRKRKGGGKSVII